MASAKRTQDHETIREWVEDRHGKPAIVRATHHNEEGNGILRVKFDDSEENLEDVDWDEFFETFDSSDLIFLYQDDPGRESRFFKFIRE